MGLTLNCLTSICIELTIRHDKSDNINCVVAGMVASLTSLPVIGVPVKTQSLSGLDSLLSIVQVSVLQFFYLRFKLKFVP
jgi:hypothetical protein